MIKEQTHIIQKLNIDIDVPDLKTARHIYHNFPGIWNDKILPLLEKRLKSGIDDNTARFEKLSFELTSPSIDGLEELLSIKLGDELLKVSGQNNLLVSADNKKNNSAEDTERKEQVTPQETIINSFLYFLRYGQKPWYIPQNAIWPDEEAIKEAIYGSQNNSGISLLTLFSENKVALERLIHQFSYEFCFFIIEYFTGIKKNELIEVISPEKRFEDQYKNIEELLRVVFKMITDGALQYENYKALPDTEFKKNLNDHLKQKLIAIEEPGIDFSLEQEKPKHPDKKELNNKTENADLENEIYITLGGLVLLHPFLQYFFKEFQLVNEEGFLNEQSQETAIHLLYFLATGKENPYEHELVFVKHLCEWPRSMPLKRFITLTEEMKKESYNLLNAVIRHWPILKNTSPEGLRESFLQRNGKLLITDHQHKLILEKNTIDILLEHVPWNHSIISLPWMKKILYAEW